MAIDWSELYEHRQATRARFGDIWDLPVDRRYHKVLARVGQSGCSMLEVGAGDRGLKLRMNTYWGEFDYRSCDIDQRQHHDFHHIDEVDGHYDVVCAFEIIEHVTLEDAHHLLSQCFEHTQTGGVIALTTPNIYYPPAFLRDATHITPFCYDELGGLLGMVGYQVTGIYRLYHESLLKKLLRRYLGYPLFRLLGIDFAKQIMVVAEKPS